MLNREAALHDVKSTYPDLVGLFDIYVNEADFAISIIDSDLKRLDPQAQVIEVGSGIGLVALYVAAQGFKVTAIEPAPAEFGSMTIMREIAQRHWHGQTGTIEWVESTGEDFLLANKGEIDFAYAINVIEHVQSVEQTIWNTVRHLKPEGCFRFVCPNYDFPYEAHFNIPTVWQKDLTFRIFKDRIANTNDLEDPIGLWDGLSWPSVRTLHRDAVKGVTYEFTAAATKAYFDRLQTSAEFSERKGSLFKAIQPIAGAMGTNWLDYIPKSVLPIIDCTVRQRNS